MTDEKMLDDDRIDSMTKLGLLNKVEKKPLSDAPSAVALATFFHSHECA